MIGVIYSKAKGGKTSRYQSIPFTPYITSTNSSTVMVCDFFHTSHISVFGLVSNHSLIFGEFDTRSRCAFSNSDWSRAVGKSTPRMTSIRSSKAKSPTVICKKKKTEWVESNSMSISSLKSTTKHYSCFVYGLSLKFIHVFGKETNLHQ